MGWVDRIAAWYWTKRKWKTVGNWQRECCRCGYVDHGYSYGLPDRAVYYDEIHECDPDRQRPNA